MQISHVFTEEAKNVKSGDSYCSINIIKKLLPKLHRRINVWCPVQTCILYHNSISSCSNLIKISILANPFSYDICMFANSLNLLLANCYSFGLRDRPKAISRDLVIRVMTWSLCWMDFNIFKHLLKDGLCMQRVH